MPFCCTKTLLDKVVLAQGVLQASGKVYTSASQPQQHKGFPCLYTVVTMLTKPN